MSITYTFPASCPVPKLRGVTCTGGKFSTTLIERKLVDVVVFQTRIEGKTVTALIAGKPELEEAFAAHKTALALTASIKQAALDAAVPGLLEYEAAMKACYNAIDAYDRASERGYPVHEAQAAKLADEALQAVHTEYPATRLWRRIVAAQQSSHYEQSRAGDRAYKAILVGTPIAEAVATMDAEWLAAAQRCVDNA